MRKSELPPLQKNLIFRLFSEILHMTSIIQRGLLFTQEHNSTSINKVRLLTI